MTQETNQNMLKSTIWIKVTNMLDILELEDDGKMPWEECEKQLKNINDSIHNLLENGLTNNLRS